MEKKTYKDYRMQLKLSYSDDKWKAVEQSILMNPGTNFKKFINECSKLFEVIAHAYGEDFDAANEAANQEEAPTSVEKS